MPAELEPNVDAYGTHARASALADFMELWAIGGHNPSMAALADLIGQLGWTTKMHELFTPVPGGDLDHDAEDDEAEELGNNEAVAARRVFDVLDERVALLADRYPFTKANDRLYFNGDIGAAYLVCLAITTAHAYQVPTGHDPKSVFEGTVARALQGCARRAVNFSGLRPEHGSFSEALVAAAELVGLRATPDAGAQAIFANDENVDVLGHMDWLDGRLGTWTFLGQVTCGATESWVGKLQEVPVPGWMKFLGQLNPPQAFLAIPHHIEPRHLYYLLEQFNRPIVDRLRVTLWLGDPTDDEVALTQAVLATPVASPQ